VERLLEEPGVERTRFWFQGFGCFVRPMLRIATGGVVGPEILDSGSGTGAQLANLEEYGRPTGVDVTWTGLCFAAE
jgi:hypothetical protein